MHTWKCAPPDFQDIRVTKAKVTQLAVYHDFAQRKVARTSMIIPCSSWVICACAPLILVSLVIYHRNMLGDRKLGVSLSCLVVMGGNFMDATFGHVGSAVPVTCVCFAASYLCLAGNDSDGFLMVRLGTFQFVTALFGLFGSNQLTHWLLVVSLSVVVGHWSPCQQPWASPAVVVALQQEIQPAGKSTNCWYWVIFPYLVFMTNQHLIDEQLTRHVGGDQMLTNQPINPWWWQANNINLLTSICCYDQAVKNPASVGNAGAALPRWMADG